MSQQKAVEDICAAEDTNLWVAIDADSTVGFVAMKLHSEDSMGEIYMVAVDPDFQCRGIGSAFDEHCAQPLNLCGGKVGIRCGVSNRQQENVKRSFEHTVPI
ncbi:GNAT family N-acetyltransferase [Leptothermofonsia sp. ETS-13]|uniref:GNAT family N-acetyltransferase n=1 Tax=Leptothermofonsia sp. ETS-13 TaxID=3035696 RepID=UPI003BA3D3BA